MKNYSALIFLFFLTFVIAGCDKDDDAEPTKEEIIMSKNWKVTEAKAVPTGLSTEFNLYGLLVDCQKDNFLDFNTGGVVVVDEGPTKCTPNAPQTVPGTWSFQENATTGDVITINGNILLSYGLTTSAPRNLKVVTLTNQTLKVTFNEGLTLPGTTTAVPSKIDLTFTAQ
ncbi:hypothetical protein AAE02nite_04520 [Adhaeribacter aerolatus]|uniref:Lipocalin-like domain-containing protein n=1 Tax=Adhaeribacter aerolatus TaxID=670289 RepID=A0A512ASX3_9BACT|nr:hypothetical protein [Adhaeribacter aerolatus]GEO02788.1 hypothetical protein AAE02nite_04520 [Adhaeribacter aerolatus]